MAKQGQEMAYACYDTGSSMSIFIEPELAGATLTPRKIGQATASHVFYSQYVGSIPFLVRGRQTELLSNVVFSSEIQFPFELELKVSLAPPFSIFGIP